MVTVANVSEPARRYFLTVNDVEREVDAEAFIAMERACGFHPKPGCGPFATAGFSSHGMDGCRKGRIEIDRRDA